jgi:hypothetical protein
LSSDFSTFDAAVTAAANKTLVVNSTLSVPVSKIVLGVALEFTKAGFLNIPNGVALSTDIPIVAGNYQIFSSSSLVISPGARNPYWWGAVSSVSSPGPTVAANNTLAFRKAALSFYSDYVLNVGTLATPGPFQYPYEVVIPAGLFYLSNGFATPVGVKVSGAGTGTLLCRLTANADSDTAIPLLTAGQSLAAAPGLAYQNDPGTGQSSSAFTGAGFAETAPVVDSLYFVDQNPTNAAFHPAYPGMLFSNLFFTSCGVSLDFNGCNDVTCSNIIVDMGLTGIILQNCQNINLNNVILYNQVSRALAVTGGAYDVNFTNVTVEYPQAVGVSLEGTGGNNLNFSNVNFVSNIQYGGFAGCIKVTSNNTKATFTGCQFRNSPGVVVSMTAVTNTELTFNNCIWDGLKTNPAYTQSATMVAFVVSGGTIRIRDGVMQNLFGSSIFAGIENLHVDGLDYGSMNSNPPFDISSSTSGEAIFQGVRGDGIVGMLKSQSLSGISVKVKGCENWLGAPFADGAFYAWNVPLPPYGQIMSVVSACTDGTTGLRKSISYVWEKSTEVLPTVTDTITGVSLFASPIANAHPQASCTLVFANTSTTADTFSPGISKIGKLRVPNTFSAPFAANADFIS